MLEKIKDIMKEENISIKELAEKTRIKQSTLYYILSSEGNFNKTSYENTKKILSAIGINKYKNTIDIINKYDYMQEVYRVYGDDEIEKVYYIGFVNGQYVIQDNDECLDALPIDEIFETRQLAELWVLESKKDLLEEDLKNINRNIELVKKEIENNGR